MSEALYLEDIDVGSSWKSPARTVTESDIVSFAGMTGDFDPLHVDHEFAAETPYGKPIAHGLLGMSFMAGLSSNHPRMRTLAFVRIDDWQFLKPIFVGDTIHVVTSVASISPKGRRSGEVIWDRSLVNQKGETVQAGKIVTLVSAESFLPRTRKTVPEPASARLEKLRKVAAEKIDAMADNT